MFFCENDFKPYQSANQAIYSTYMGPLYYIWGVGGPKRFKVCDFFGTPQLDKWSRIRLICGKIIERIYYVIYYSCNTSKCLWFVNGCCWATTIWTCFVWAVVPVHC